MASSQSYRDFSKISLVGFLFLFWTTFVLIKVDGTKQTMDDPPVPDWPEIVFFSNFTDGNPPEAGNFTMYFWRRHNQRRVTFSQNDNQIRVGDDFADFSLQLTLRYSPTKAGVPYGTQIACDCMDWNRTIEFDQEFNAARIDPSAVYVGTSTCQPGKVCLGFNYNWSAQGPNRNVTFWTVKSDDGHLIPIQFDNPYDGGVWMYTQVSLQPDYSNWFEYQNFCTPSSVENCGYGLKNSNKINLQE